MSKIPKTTHQKLGELEDHMLFSDTALRQILAGESAHLRQLTAELRTLVCYSSGTEGLLWRLVDELRVSDDVLLHRLVNLNRNGPLFHKLQYFRSPAHAPGHGHPGMPVSPQSFRWMIKEHEAIFYKDRGITHETLIKWLAQQMGTSHEGNEVSETLAILNGIQQFGTQDFFEVVAIDALLTLHLAERVIKHAVAQIQYTRKRPPPISTTVELSELRVPPGLKLDAPQVDSLSSEEWHTIFIVGHDAIGSPGLSDPIQLQNHAIGSIRIASTYHLDHTLELHVAGLTTAPIPIRCPIPEGPCSPHLTLGVAWKKPSLFIDINGKKVATINL